MRITIDGNFGSKFSACPDGAATLVAYKCLIADGFLRRDETTMIFNIGSGYKYLQLIEGASE